jgi:hypothetical protein
MVSPLFFYQLGLIALVWLFMGYVLDVVGEFLSVRF